MGQPMECTLWGSLWNVFYGAAYAMCFMEQPMECWYPCVCLTQTVIPTWQCSFPSLPEQTKCQLFSYYMISLGWRNDLMKQESKVFLNYITDIQFGRTQQNPIHDLKSNQYFCVYFIAVPLCRRLFYFLLIQICRSFNTIADSSSSSVCSVNVLCLLSFRIVNCTLETQPKFASSFACLLTWIVVTPTFFRLWG
jgi:hypothetical protein